MVKEMKEVDLVNNLENNDSLQFLDRLEKNGMINSGKKLRLKDEVETRDKEPRVENLTEKLRKELKNMNIFHNRGEVFVSKSKEMSTHYVSNDDDRKSRYGDWRNNL